MGDAVDMMLIIDVGVGTMNKYLSDADKDRAVAIAQEISKYSFMASFYICYPNSIAQQSHCLENLDRAVKELNDIIVAKPQKASPTFPETDLSK